MELEKENYRLDVKKDGDMKVVEMHNRYEINKQSILYNTIEGLISLLKAKESKKPNDNLSKVTNYTYFPSFQFLLLKVEPHKELCCICQFQYELHHNFQEEVTKSLPSDIVCTGRCQHLFHKECLNKFVGNNSYMKCPVCSIIYGTIIGDQPQGTMSVSKNKMCLPGYQKCGTIIISYNMLGGNRNGKHYPPTNRTGYLPDCAQGLRVLKLLETAFQRKLVFTVGRSVTTGADNVIVWNGIHHKTSTHGGSSHFGYPDPTYLYRVTEQLSAKGIY